MPQYDYLVVGAGLFGAVFAHEMKERGKRVLVVEKRSHIGGNVYTENMDGIEVHAYGVYLGLCQSICLYEALCQLSCCELSGGTLLSAV